MNIKITPYHLLCILNNFGEGNEIFQPDLKSKNDYYFLANAIIFKDVEHISFTIKNDDICNPCIYLNNKICTEVTVENSLKVNKNDYYIDLNKMLFDQMNLIENNLYDFNFIINFFDEIITNEIINKCWSLNSKEDNLIIFKNIKSGLKKLLNNSLLI